MGHLGWLPSTSWFGLLEPLANAQAEGARADFCIAFEGGVEEDSAGRLVCFAVVARPHGCSQRSAPSAQPPLDLEPRALCRLFSASLSVLLNASRGKRQMVQNESLISPEVVQNGVTPEGVSLRKGCHRVMPCQTAATESKGQSP